jgi:hypothetical protein
MYFGTVWLVNYVDMFILLCARNTKLDAIAPSYGAIQQTTCYPSTARQKLKVKSKKKECLFYRLSSYFNEPQRHKVHKVK